MTVDDGAARRANHAHWEAVVQRDGTDAGEVTADLDLIRAGGTVMGDEERRAVDLATRGAGVAGLAVLHLQCHVGCDSVTLARLGAAVTAVDFSRAALDRVEALAAECGVAVETVEADATALPDALSSRFDLVYATIGVLGWIGDLDAWMAGVARALRPGGALALVELHPIVTMVDSLDPLVVEFPYGFDGPHAHAVTWLDAGRDDDGTTVQYAHSIGETVTAAARAGLVCTHLVEHTSAPFNTGQFDGPEDDGRFRLRLGVGALVGGRRAPASPMPMLFTLVAQRPATSEPSAEPSG